MTQVTSGDRLVNDVSGQRRVTVWYEVSRRTLDVIGSLLLLAFTLPILLVVAFLIKIDSRGPVLYRQSRVGLHGRIFTMLKFRSMRVDAEAAGPCWAAKRDPRMTRIGAFIRATRLDEVPQLLNVLRGEMSLVGPRPERPHFVQQLAAIIPRYNERTHVLPGITGWAQINYPYGSSVGPGSDHPAAFARRPTNCGPRNQNHAAQGRLGNRRRRTPGAQYERP
jgi:lipopolysaccharide/colanic/teichoic acid biosynthesis glycosyltransferase